MLQRGEMRAVTVGVLALQGAFIEHIQILQTLGVATREVRLPHDLENLQALIIPGGESTTIGKLAMSFHLMEPLRAFVSSHPTWGTCAGAIFLARDAHRKQPLLQMMDIQVERNAFGRQVDSFITDLDVSVLEDPTRPFPGVFIRAPLIESVGPGVDVLARVERAQPPGEASIVAARQQTMLATSFHPELTNDDRFHRYFLDMLKG